MWLASDHLDFRGDDAVAAAWLRRAEGARARPRAVPRARATSPARAPTSRCCATCDPPTALRLARRGDRAWRAASRTSASRSSRYAVLGSALVARGDGRGGAAPARRVRGAGGRRGLRRSSSAPGWALCHTVSVCANVGDFGRAGQWCRALHTWSARWHGAPLLRRLPHRLRRRARHRAATGATAEQELLSALDDLSTTRPAMAAPTAVRLGRLRARQGDLRRGARAVRGGAAAAAADPRARRAGPGRRATPRPAADAADRVLRRAGRRERPRSLPGARAARARSRRARATRTGATRGGRRARARGRAARTPYMRGRGRLVRAEVLSAAGDHDGARRAAEDAADLFAACSAPYEAARCAAAAVRGARRRSAAPDRAEAEARAAREAFALLRATRRPTTRSPRSSARGRSRSCASSREGLGDAQIAERLFLSPHTVHRHVANIRDEAPRAVARGGGRARHPATACSEPRWPVPAIAQDGRSGRRRARRRGASVAPMTDDHHHLERRRAALPPARRRARAGRPVLRGQPARCSTR